MVKSQDAVHLEFHEYDWELFQEFQEGLAEILESHLNLLKEQDPSVKVIPPAEKQQLIDQAKLFFFCTKTGHILNLDEYYAWRRNNGGKIALLDDSKEKKSESPVIEDKETLDNAPANEETPYSSNYQQLVDLIVSGKPVPGIKQIPDTVLSDQSSKLEAKSRVKPWEKNGEEHVASSTDIQEMTS